MLKSAHDDLKRSGITDIDADNAEMFTVEDASTIYKDFKPWPALVIPYINPWNDEPMEFLRNGEAEPFARVRYFEEPCKKSFTKQKPLRYGQPKNSGVHPYFPIVEGIDWLAVVKDPTIPIMITEGEKKALSACLAGIPTIGLGGVYNFTHDGELLPILEDVVWKGRAVYLCYDSDASTNNKIQVAESRLATELSMKRGAGIFLVRLPEGEGGLKVGVDDFLVQNDAEALFELIERAPEMRKMDREVLRMNADAAWIDSEGLLLDLKTDTFMKKADFVKGSHFGTRKTTVPNKKGDGTREVSVADLWLTHPHARRYSDTTFRPGTEDKAIEMPNGGVAYNRFRGLRPQEGDVQPFFDLYDWLMSRTDEFDHDLIWKTIAHKMQNLEYQTGLGLVLLGAQGSGKTIFCQIIADMVEPYDKVMTSSEMGSDFNGWVETSLVVLINEAESSQLKRNMNQLKTWVTDEKQPMNEKYRVNRQVNNYSFFMFNSNELSAGAFADDDRRMIVLGCPDAHPDGTAFYDPIWEWSRSGGAKKLLNFFLNYDLEGWTPPRHAPDTREKRSAFNLSLTPIQKLGRDIKGASESIITMWLSASLEWSQSDQVGSNPQSVALADDIARMLKQIQVRPFYTPEELSLMFPSIVSTLHQSKSTAAGPANKMAQELRQMGVDYLRCEENWDGFLWKGQIRQFLVIQSSEELKKPITQARFEELMATYPTYAETLRIAKQDKVKRASKRK
tara:strand:+ start:35822 stop:38020 length:2199 start_codon:yes stop_codon:yes gene_type:complete